MRPSDRQSVTVIRLGEMVRALAGTFLKAGRRVTVWNRTASKSTEMVADGASVAESVGEAISAAPLVVVCVLDDAAVRSLLQPLAESLSGRTLVNLTTGTPLQARKMAAWAARHDIDYLDGGVMAVPAMIGAPSASLLYSGSAEAWQNHSADLAVLGSSRYLGADAGLAALYDLAMLAAMYSMIAGIHQATAMVGTAGVSAAEFLPMVVPFVQAMADSQRSAAEACDTGDHSAGVQDLTFTRSAIDVITTASSEQGLDATVLDAIGALIDGQIAAGHGSAMTTRMIEGIRSRTGVPAVASKAGCAVTPE